MYAWAAIICNVLSRPRRQQARLKKPAACSQRASLLPTVSHTPPSEVSSETPDSTFSSPKKIAKTFKCLCLQSWKEDQAVNLGALTNAHTSGSALAHAMKIKVAWLDIFLGAISWNITDLRHLVGEVVSITKSEDTTSSSVKLMVVDMYDTTERATVTTVKTLGRAIMATYIASSELPYSRAAVRMHPCTGTLSNLLALQLDHLDAQHRTVHT
ncbi:hypothetical protein K491DRAFT_723003 [Lophiostoma macrostomum CBS 122681]|uniref:Uncharacterized protein n=1 Tax=Lophiostoma macrostomum CBS 122681 TaxID=1314788 RepID=A0A6A6SJ94_9PLEO|nr:hypothetical protein K491DRAFT_723003 [Lophiostoma macrostomum CBS 122681]